MLKFFQGGAVEIGTPGGALHITAILNPLTRSAQRISQVLKFLRELLGPSMSLYLNPFRELAELPLKSYYRWGAGRERMQGLLGCSSTCLADAAVLLLQLYHLWSWQAGSWPAAAMHSCRHRQPRA